VELNDAIEAMVKVRAALRTQRGINDPAYISENMQKLAQFVSAIEEHLAVLEEQLEAEEMKRFIRYTRTEGKSINQAEILAKQEVGELKGQIAKLKRYVNSSWAIVGTAQSRFNHLSSDFKLGKHTT
jgi:septation ring formation regulator EzrA